MLQSDGLLAWPLSIWLFLFESGLSFMNLEHPSVSSNAIEVNPTQEHKGREVGRAPLLCATCARMFSEGNLMRAELGL